MKSRVAEVPAGANAGNVAARTAGVAMLLVAALAACDQPVANPSGTLIVSNATTGAAFDPDGSTPPLWSADGRRIAVSEHHGPGAGTSRISFIELDGSDPVAIAELQGFPIALADLVERRRIPAARAHDDLYLFRLSDRTLFRLTTDGTYRGNNGAKFWPMASSGAPDISM